MKAEGKTSFVLFHDIREPLQLLSDEDRGKLFMAILDYSEYGQIPDFKGALAMAFAFIRTSMDRNAAAWEQTREKRREAGRKGGKQAQANAYFAKQALANQAVSVSVPVPVPVNVPVSVSESITATPRLALPSEDEVRAYCLERGNDIDPCYFIDYYSARGWEIKPGQPMRDWKAMVRTWEQKGFDKPKAQMPPEDDLSDLL